MTQNQVVSSLKKNLRNQSFIQKQVGTQEISIMANSPKGKGEGKVNRQSEA